MDTDPASLEDSYRLYLEATRAGDPGEWIIDQDKDGRAIAWRKKENPYGSSAPGAYLESRWVPTETVRDGLAAGKVTAWEKKLVPVRREDFKGKERQRKGYIHRSGHNMKSAQWNTDDRVALLSKSSFNRKKKDRRKVYPHCQPCRPAGIWIDQNPIPLTRINPLDREYFYFPRRPSQYARGWIPKMYLQLDGEPLPLEGRKCKKMRRNRYRKIVPVHLGKRLLYPRGQTPQKPPAIHRMSGRTRGNVKDRLAALYDACAENSTTFVTLTMIEHCTDHHANRMFRRLARILTTDDPLFDWGRVAEHQPDRPEKTIHFHAVFSKQVRVEYLNALWTQIQYDGGLRGRSLKFCRIIQPMEMLKRYQYTMDNHAAGNYGKDYKKGSVQEVFNPATIQKVSSIQGSAAYVAGYVQKQDEGEEFTCRVWDCSRRVSRMFLRQVVGKGVDDILFSEANNRITKKGHVLRPWWTQSNFSSCIGVANKNLILPEIAMMREANRWIKAGFVVDKVPTVTAGFYQEHIAYEADGRALQLLTRRLLTPQLKKLPDKPAKHKRKIDKLCTMPLQ